MELNKRKCRAFASPVLKFSSGNGILHAKQISYIVRTAVKIIDHYKTLVLYVYSRKQVLNGNYKPCYTVFQNHDDFITFTRKEDGRTTWRKSEFNNLDNSYNFSNKCAFYSAKDETCISRYFKSTDKSFKPLVKAQDAILQYRRQERQRIKEKAIISRMSCIPTLPRGLSNWVKSIMPAYFFYDYKRGGNNVSGVCSSCGREIILSGVKQGNKSTCPRCRHELIAKPRSRRGAYMYDRDTFTIIQNTGGGGLVVRILKVYCNYHNDTPDVKIYENARQFIWHDTHGEIHIEDCYYSYNSGVLTGWHKGNRPMFNKWQYNFQADTCGHLYTKNLPNALQNTPWQYCPVDRFYNHFREPMQILPFLNAYLEHPRLEHLIKVGFYNIVSDLVYRYGKNGLDETQNRTHQILKIAAEDVAFLRKLDADLSVLKTFKNYNGIKDRQKLLLWQIEHKINCDIMPILCHMTVHKMIRYLDEQYSFLCLRRTPNKTMRYNSLNALVTEYRDYLDVCVKLGYDMKNNFVLYPKDLQKSHDKTAKRVKHKTDAKMKRDFIEIYKHLAGKFDFEQNGLKIVCPTVPDDVVAEGHKLHHCVGSGNYIDRVAKHECIILFLRKCSDESKPYYTIEVRDHKVIQVRGMKNCEMTPDVEKFISAWEQQVLSKLKLVA